MEIFTQMSRLIIGMVLLDNMKFSCARVERESTGSWLTIKPYMGFYEEEDHHTVAEWEAFVKEFLPNWELVCCANNIK